MKTSASVYLSLLLIPAMAGAVTSTDALPRNVRAAALVYGFAPMVDSTFDDKGKLDYLVSPLNRSVTFEELAKFEPELNRLKNVIDSIYPQGIGNQLLQADLFADAKVFEQRYVSALLWGITDRISVGVQVPITKRRVEASFDARVTNQGDRLGALVGQVPQLKQAAKDLAAAKVDTELFAQKIFTEYGYQTPSSYEKSGLGDIEVEGRYLYYKSDMLNLAARVNLKIPTGEPDSDLTNLLDRPIGGGHYALKAGVLEDFKPFGPRWIFSSAMYLTYNFDGQQIKAIRRTKSQLLPDLNDPSQVESVAKKTGIDFSSDLALSRSLFGGVVWMAVSYLYSYHGADEYSGRRSLDYSSLSENTQTAEHGFEYSLEVSSISLFMRELFPVPGKLVFAWYQPVKGRNALYTPYGRMDFALLF